MPDGSPPSSWTMRLLRASTQLLLAVVLLVITVELLARIWVALLAIAVIGAAAVIGVRWWHRRQW